MLVWLQILLLFFQITSDNPIEFKWVMDIPVNSDSFTTDQLNNIYGISNNQITKYNLNDKSTNSYSAKTNGTINSIDVSDPFQILVFYKDFNRLVFLDNKLAELRSAVQLNDLGYYNVAAAGISARGGFWIYDQEIFQLIHLDKTLQVSHKSSPLLDLFDNSLENRNAIIIEKNDFIYLGISGQGVFQFDIYGTYIKRYPIDDFNKFQIIGQNIIFLSQNKLKIYNTQTYETEENILPVKNVIDCRIEGTQLFLLLNDRISVYNTH